jgi:hypothetical protein
MYALNRSSSPNRSACAAKRFARLSNGFSKKIDCHLAAVNLHVAFYNWCRTHEALRRPSAALRMKIFFGLAPACHLPAC